MFHILSFQTAASAFACVVLPSPPEAVLPPPYRLALHVSLGFTDHTDDVKPLALDLPDPLPCDAYRVPDLVKLVKVAIPHARPHPQDVSGAVVQVQKLGLAKGVERRRPETTQRNLMAHGPRSPAASDRHEVGVEQAVAVVLHFSRFYDLVLRGLPERQRQCLHREGAAFLPLVHLQDAEPERVVQRVCLCCVKSTWA